MKKEEKRFMDEEEIAVLSPVDVEEAFQGLGLCPHGYPEGECDYCLGGVPDIDEDDLDPGFHFMT